MSHSRISRRPLRGAAVAFSLAVGTAAFVPSVAGALPANANAKAPSTRVASASTTQLPTGSNGVNHNDATTTASGPCASTAGTTGSCSSIQPLSTADSTNQGANTTSTSNPYGSTRSGLPSDNGSGTGAAKGEPCAGCVGRADNKNPPGQAPSGPLDHNNGYECDGNNGIGQSNPAHTGCTSTGTTTTSTGTTTTSTGATATSPGMTSGEATSPSTGGTTPTGGTTATGGTTPTGGTGGSVPSGSSGNVATNVLALQGSRTGLAVQATAGATPAAAQTSPASAVLPTAVAATSLGAASLPFTGLNVEALSLIATALLLFGGGALFLGVRRQGLSA